MPWYSRLQDWYSSERHSDPNSGHVHNVDALQVEETSFDGHIDRGFWMEGLAPDHLPSVDPYFDPQTGITWHHDSPISTYIWHGGSSGDDGNHCVRGELPQTMVDAWHANPMARDAFNQVDADRNYDFDRITPGAQACYDARGNLIDSGTQQGTWDYASPGVDGQTGAHWDLDVVPDYQNDDYTHYNQAVHSDAVSAPSWETDYDTGISTSSDVSNETSGHDVGGGLD